MIETHKLRYFDLRSIVEFLGQDEHAGNTSLYSAVLDTLRNVNLQHVKPLSTPIIANLREALRVENAESHFNRLLKLGVHEETFAAALFLFNLLPGLDETLRTFMGVRSVRERKARVLREAASIVDGFAMHIPGVARESLGSSSDVLSSPRIIADSLHFYAKMLSMYEQFRKAFDVNSGLEIARYTLAASVKQITGRYYDRDVSGITGVILGSHDYDETAHRVWRDRTVKRLNPACSALPVILHAFNTALAEQVNNAAHK